MCVFLNLATHTIAVHFIFLYQNHGSHLSTCGTYAGHCFSMWLHCNLTCNYPVRCAIRRRLAIQ